MQNNDNDLNNDKKLILLKKPCALYNVIDGSGNNSRSINGNLTQKFPNIRTNSF